jgi:putative membrane protein
MGEVFRGRSPSKERKMTRLLIHWVISALLLLVVSRIVPGFNVNGFGAALIAAVVIGLVNATVGLFLKVLTFPLTIFTFGIFLLIINALMLMLASKLLRGFHVSGFAPAFWGALLLSLLHMLLSWITPARNA